MEKKILHTEAVKGGAVTYFFDLKEAKNGKPYLSIVESRLGEGGASERVRMLVFQENFDKFAEALGRAVAQAQAAAPAS